MQIRHLYVVGESSPDPESWLPWSEFSLVIARTPKEAREITGELDGVPVAVISMDESKHLITMPEYPGDDDDWLDDDWVDRSEWIS